MSAYTEAVEKAKQEILLRFLDDAGWCIAAAARLAGLHRGAFYKLMAKTGISSPYPKYAHRGRP